MIHTPNTLEETYEVAKRFTEDLSPKETATVIGLYGNLGAGKTSFSQGVAQALGVTEMVTSPTFVIEKIYDLEGKKFDRLVHIDAYRLEKPEELLHLGWEEITKDPKNLILIEWPERVGSIMPPHIEVRLKTQEIGDGREIEIVV